MGARVVTAALVTAIVAATFALHLHRLADPEVAVWDESFHAIVAANLLDHPLTPTLIDRPYLAYDPANWHENHVWLHKPILPLWTIAASFSILGVDRFALRLPSAILGAACVLLTYSIGRRLFGRVPGIVAAGLMGASPAMAALVRGRWFADHVDVALLFWVELSVWFLLRAVESGRWQDVVACGAAQGCAYLSKIWLALIVTGLSVVAWLLAARSPSAACGADASGRSPASRFGLRHVAAIVCVAIAVVAPWTLYTFSKHREEFVLEYAAWWRHLAGEWEGWGAPWQRVVFDYLPHLHHVLYVPLAIAAAALIAPAIRERSFGLLFALAWVAGVFVPHLVAPTKTPTATLVSVPALLVLLGALVCRALRGDPWSLAAWSGLALAGLLRPAVIGPPNRGYALEPGIRSIADKNPWVLWQAGIAAALAAAIWAGGVFIRRAGSERGWRWFRTATILAAMIASLWLCGRFGKAALRIAHQVSPDQADYSGLSAFRDTLPGNAALLVAGRPRYERQLAMFHSGRPSYDVGSRAEADAVAAAIRRAGGEPLLVAIPSGGYPLDGLRLLAETAPNRPAIYAFP